jgi:HSP20 family protein
MSDQNELCNETACNALATDAHALPTYRPHYSSRYDEHAWEVVVRLPGVSRESVSVTVENEILEVKATRRFDLPAGWRALGQHEPTQSYRLRLDVGPEVDETRISGGLEDGVLTLRLPLREEVKPRSIEIH